MQFRERRRVIQMIRTTYDPAVKRGRSEVVGKIDKDAPAIPEKLRKSCSAEELAEIESWLAERETAYGPKPSGMKPACWRSACVRPPTTSGITFRERPKAGWTTRRRHCTRRKSNWPGKT